MKIKPILFNTEMVKAILAGRKLQTRRIVKYSHGEVLNLASWFDYNKDSDKEPLCFWFDVIGKFDSTYDCIEPYARAGDILYVRETWSVAKSEYGGVSCAPRYIYRADYNDAEAQGWKWKPSIHMPKEAARLFLRVNKVKIERLQDISESDINSEGSTPEEFENLWNSTMKESELNKYSFEANPLVWVYEFERCEKPE